MLLFRLEVYEHFQFHQLVEFLTVTCLDDSN